MKTEIYSLCKNVGVSSFKLTLVSPSRDEYVDGAGFNFEQHALIGENGIRNVITFFGGIFLERGRSFVINLSAKAIITDREL